MLAVSCGLIIAATATAAQTQSEPQAATASPLAPVATSSPRQTFRSFRGHAQQAEASLLEALELARSNDSIIDSPKIRALKQQALKNLAQAASTLDLSAIPPASRRTVGVSSVLLLNEIMDRISLPADQAIPGVKAVEAGAGAQGWRVPGTELRMSVVEGADGNRYLFSAGTVSRLPEFYALVRDVPVQSGSQMDFYQSFVLGPGLSMPIELYRYVLELPSWMLVDHHEQAVWQRLAFVVLTVMIGAIIFFLLRAEGENRKQPSGTLSRSLRRLITPITIIALLAGYLWLNNNVVNLSGDVLAGVELTVVVLQALALAVAIVMAFNAVAALVISMPRVRKESLDASLIRLVLRVVGILVAGYVMSLAATRVGIPLYGILASLGVGGLALALAVRPTLENFIGGIILYADRPVKVGDFCQFGQMLGTVESIGLRSTKVRGLDRTLVTVQNAEFAQMSITNFTRRDSNLMHTTIRLRYETTPEQLSTVIEAMAEMLRDDERVNPESVRVCLRALGVYSLDIEIWAYVACPDWGQFLAIQAELYMRIIEIVHTNGCDFALPSQTNYLDSDRLATEQAEMLRKMVEQGNKPDQLENAKVA